MMKKETQILLKQGMTSLSKILVSGFDKVSETTYKKRLEACSQCPFYVDAPQSLLYVLAKNTTFDPKICKQCGCFTGKKAKYVTEQCPEKHNKLSGMSRWEERIL